MSESVSALLRRHGLAPLKQLGQNFLVDAAFAQRIVDAAQLTANERVVEIGPGLGGLTIPLLKRTGRLHAIEFDSGIIPVLKERALPHGELTVQEADALKVNYTDLAGELGGPFHLIANLPYNISTPILLHLLDHLPAITGMTLMFQDELADRLAAQPNSKNYGALTVKCALWLDIKKLFRVPAEAFHPRPRIVSAIISLRPLPAPRYPVDDLPRFKRIVEAAFGQRRKTLRNALRAAVDDPASLLEAAGIDPRRRGETLSLEEFVRLASAHLITE